MKTLISFLLAVTAVFAQTTVPLTAVAPPAATGGLAAVVGGNGLSTYYYWVVANYTGGKAVAAGPYAALRAPASLSAGNYIRITWNAATSATSYDVLRTTTTTAPVSRCNCAVAIATTSTAVSDTSDALSAYVVSATAGSAATIYLDNLSVTPPVLKQTIDGVTSTIGSGGGGSVTAGLGISVNAGEVSVNTAVTQTHPDDQSGRNVYCRSTTGNAAYSCAMNPSLTAYTTGMVIRLNPNFANVTTATLNIDGLGVKSLLKRDGTALAAADFPADKITLVSYDGTNFNIVGDGGGGAATPTLLDVYAPFGNPTGAEIAFNPGATVVKAYSFTPTLNLSFTKIAWQGSGAGYVSFGIWSFDGATKITNSAAVCLSPGTGNGGVCSFAGTVTLTAGTTYRLAWAADAATGLYVSNGGSLAYNTGAGSGFPFSFGSVAIGTAANVSSSSGATLALPATLGTITANTASITHNAYPAVVLIP